MSTTASLYTEDAMNLRFSGTYDQLREKLGGLKEQGEWQDVNEDQKQFKHQSGAVLSWCPSTGTINLEGRPDGLKEIERLVAAALSGPSATDSSEQARPSPEAASEQAVTGEARKESHQDIAVVAAELPPEQAAAHVRNVPLRQTFSKSELVLGLVRAVGTESKKVIDVLRDRLKVFGYEVEQISVADDVISSIVKSPDIRNSKDEFKRIGAMMDAGDLARKTSGDNSVLALGVAAKIAAGRPDNEELKLRPRQAYIINSLKHPEEVERLREIYPEAFYLIGIHADQKRRHRYLVNDRRITEAQATRLMERDEDEHLEYGQRTSDTFHMSDFFVRIDGNDDKLKESLWRVLDILFGDPYRTPTFDEFAMFMAFSASLRSADLSRQVGAVVAKDNEILATGANDCPRFGGGLYWPEYDEKKGKIADQEDGRDYMRREDSNRTEQSRIIENIIQRVGDNVKDKDKLRRDLEGSRINDLTEYGRVVHAEMEALLSCARTSVSTRHATVYGTTFPCHNCAKHIIAAGIIRVVYVEPYPKSKAAEFHSDSISLGFSEGGKPSDSATVRFEPFVGIGPRRFFDLFSMRLGSGYRLKRKHRSGSVVEWRPEDGKLRTQMLPVSYLDLEMGASEAFKLYREQIGEKCDEG